jgi:hypothetical protein
VNCRNVIKPFRKFEMRSLNGKMTNAASIECDRMSYYGRNEQGTLRIMRHKEL